jgi:hypothetical protein
VIKEWYSTDLDSNSGIRAYYFIDPFGVGIISPEETGALDDPISIAITYPHGTNLPVSDSSIEVVYDGVSYTANSGWEGKSDGIYTRNCTVTAENGDKKHYHLR